MTEQIAVAGRWLALQTDTAWGDLQYTGRHPRGCWTAEWRMAPGDRGIYRGQPVDIYDGASPVWAGHIASVDPLTGTYQADGAAREAEKRLGLDSGGAASAGPTTAIAAAITRGMNWAGHTIASFSGDLPVDAASLDDGPLYLQQLLDAGAEQRGEEWWVGPDRIARMGPTTTTPTWFLAPGFIAPGVDDEEYAQYLFGRYYSSTTSTYQTAIAEDTLAPYGGAEKAVSLIGRGAMTSTKAATIMSKILQRDGSRLAVIGSVAVDASNLTNAGGTPADVRLITEGQMVRALGTFPDARRLTPYIDFVIGEVRHDATTVVTIQPLGRAATDLRALFEKGA